MLTLRIFLRPTSPQAAPTSTPSETPPATQQKNITSHLLFQCATINRCICIRTHYTPTKHCTQIRTNTVCLPFEYRHTQEVLRSIQHPHPLQLHLLITHFFLSPPFNLQTFFGVLTQQNSSHSSQPVQITKKRQPSTPCSTPSKLLLEYQPIKPPLIHRSLFESPKKDIRQKGRHSTLKKVSGSMKQSRVTK